MAKQVRLKLNKNMKDSSNERTLCFWFTARKTILELRLANLTITLHFLKFVQVQVISGHVPLTVAKHLRSYICVQQKWDISCSKKKYNSGFNLELLLIKHFNKNCGTFTLLLLFVCMLHCCDMSGMLSNINSQTVINEAKVKFCRITL